MERKDLKCVRDEQAREANVVKDAENPYEDNLSDAVLHGTAGLVVHRGHNSPEGKRDDHAGDCSQEQRASPNAVDHEGGTDGARQVQHGLTSRYLQWIP